MKFNPLSILIGLIFVTACNPSRLSSPEIAAKASTPTLTVAPSLTASPTVLSVTLPTETPPPATTASVVRLSNQMAYISGSPYAVMEIDPRVPPQCCPTLSPNGQKVAFATYMTNPQKIYVQNIDGSGLTEISSLVISNGDGPYPDPVWSPDGQYLVFANIYDIYLIKADGTNLTRLEPQGFDPAWSPGGTLLAFTSPEMDIYVMGSDGSQPRQLTTGEAQEQRPAWSPDGQLIAFVSDTDSDSHDINYEIFVMNSDGSNQRRLTNNRAQDWGPVFSPDGGHIVFTSDRSGQNGIYVMNSDGTDQRWLMPTEAKSRWRVDSTRVKFIETSQEKDQLPAEISQGVPFTLAQPFRVTPDEVKLVNVEPVTWPDDCLGISRRQPCLPGETPGYQMVVDIKGQSYEFHAPAADPLNLRLATGPVVNIESPTLLWEGEPAFFGGAEAGSCLSLSLTSGGQGALGICDGPERAVALTGEQFAQPQLWQDWLTRFAPFEADTPHGRVVFNGPGSVVASPAWQRALATWAKLAALELNDGRSGAGWDAALAWQQPLSDRPGYCQFLSVQIYGWAYASMARCEGGDPQNLGQGWIDAAAWEQFDDWFYNWAPITTDRLSFFGVGSMEMREDDKVALARWAKTLYDAHAEWGSVTVPATISQIRGSQGTLTFYPLPQPDGYVRALAIDRAGRVWVASAVNLSVLEPGTQTWTVSSAGNRLPRSVSALTIDAQGQVWAGTGNGISIFDGQTWQTDLSDLWITALAAGPDEAIWAGTSEGEVYRFDRQHWAKLARPPLGAVDAITIDQAGQVWVGGLGGVAVWNGAAWTHYQDAAGFELQKINTIAVDPNGNIWLGAGECYLSAEECTNGGVSRFDGQNWTHYFTSYFREMGGSSKRVFAITFDQAGNGWFGSGEGLREFDGQGWTSFSEFNEALGAVHAIAVDRTGNIWLGGSQAVGQLEILPLTTLTVTDPQTYTDPDLDFSLNYAPSWQLETRTGTDLNDGSGRTILLEKEGYQFKLQLQRKPDVVGECGGVLTEADLPRYWKYPLDQFEVWRAKAEGGWVNSYHDDQVSFIDIIVPTELQAEADAKGEVGSFNCSPQINDYLVNISYQLPVSVEDLKTGRFSPERLAEMDYILTSLAWK